MTPFTVLEANIDSATAYCLDNDTGQTIAIEVSVLKVNPARPGRVEPRVVKRRPKQYYRMTIPRSELRKKLPMKGF
jgi:hypothetical protein